ncbi:MAG: hypothetical protein ABW220_02135 [Burkholderiaceae bacterium]
MTYAIKPSLYLVGAEPAEQERLRSAVAPFTRHLVTFDSARSFMAAQPFDEYACVLAALALPDMPILDFVAAAGRILPVIVLGRTDDLGVAVQIMRAGAANLLDQRCDARQLRAAITAATSALQPGG